MQRPFTPNYWYWRVAGDASRVYSSKVGDYVVLSDADYQTWLGQLGAPTDVADETALGTILGGFLLRPVDTLTVVLDAYKEAVAGKLTPVDVNAKLFFNLENRVRVLEGRPELTFIQYRAIIKSLM